MNSHPSHPHRSTFLALALGAFSFIAAGCVDEPEHSYSGGYTGLGATVNEDNAMVNYDYTFDGPRSVTIEPEKAEASPGEVISAKITVKNTGTQPFYAPNKLSQKIKLMSRYEDEKEEMAEAATVGAPVMLKCHAVAPGSSVSMSVKFTAGIKPGRQFLYTNLSSTEEEVPLQVK